MRSIFWSALLFAKKEPDQVRLAAHDYLSRVDQVPGESIKWNDDSENLKILRIFKDNAPDDWPTELKKVATSSPIATQNAYLTLALYERCGSGNSEQVREYLERVMSSGPIYHGARAWATAFEARWWQD